jgi:hypothetical protein
MKKLTLCFSGFALAGGLATLPSTALAQQPELSGYIGGGVGYYRLNDEDFPDSEDELDDNRWSWRGQVGVQFNPVFSLEGGYTDFGDLEDGNLELDADGSFVAALVHLPLGGGFAPYGKLGQLWWDVERSVTRSDRGPIGGGTTIVRSSEDGNDTFYGLGVRFGEGPGLQMRIEYDRFALDDADADMASVNLQYRF